MSPVLVEHPAQGVVWLRLNRPEVRNALNNAVRAALAEHFRGFGDDSTTRCIVLSGNETAFAAGADMKEVAALGVREMMQTGSWRRHPAPGQGGGQVQGHENAAYRRGGERHAGVGNGPGQRNGTRRREVLNRALALAQHVADLPPIAVMLCKEVVLTGQDCPLDAALNLERKAFELLFDTEDQKEGMRAFTEKRKPRFEGR